jgi:hypothetical protein
MYLTAEMSLAADRSADARSRLDLRALGRDAAPALVAAGWGQERQSPLSANACG